MGAEAKLPLKAVRIANVADETVPVRSVHAHVVMITRVRVKARQRTVDDRGVNRAIVFSK